jgi:hypothetical protein
MSAVLGQSIRMRAMEGVEGAPRKRGSGRLLSVLTTCCALAAGIVACGGATDAEQPIGPVTTSDPVTTFAPLVHLHSREESFPMSTQRLLDHSTLEWSGGACFPEVNLAAGPVSQRITGEGAPRLDVERLGHEPGYRHTPRTKACTKGSGPTFSTTQHTRAPDPDRPAGIARDEGFHLDILEEVYGGEGYRVTRREGQSILPGVPAYYVREPARVAGKPGLRISYWLAYGRSESPGRGGKPVAGHEGDWERVDVLLRRLGGGDRYLPLAARLHQDGAKRQLAWKDLERESSGPSDDATHPVIFSARSSHTPYQRAGTFERRIELFGGAKAVVVDEAEACEGCPRWETWRLLRDAREEPWYGYGGGWGRKGSYDNGSGPLGPSPFGGEG